MWKVSHEIQTILSAALYAAEKHANQRRKGGEPYVNHLLDVAYLVSTAHIEPDTNVLVAALLHDSIEDVGVTAEQLTERFGPDVTSLVLEVTDDKSLPKEERKRLQVEHAPTLSAGAQTIKLADKISNLRSILSSPPPDWNYDRKKQYFEWGKQVIDGLTAPDPILKAEFEKTYQRFSEVRP
jgi:GTP diphosphokinase / guanosine-3',5'-bis(diphosphate) 3'-diphosphatase